MRVRRTKRCFFCYTAAAAFSSILLTAFSFSSSLRLLFAGTYHPVLGSTHRALPVEALSSSPLPFRVEAVAFPDQVVLFLKFPSPARLFTKDDLLCVYNSSHHHRTSHNHRPPLQIDVHDDLPTHQIVRCPPGFVVSLALRSDGIVIPAGDRYRWNSIAYEALIDNDNTTIVFVKGLHLRPERAVNASRFECVYGWDFSNPNLVMRSEALSVAQEIVRCKIPVSSQHAVNGSVKVSVRAKGSRTSVDSVARPERHLGTAESDPAAGKAHEMCVCTMVRNQARFLKEWVMYHARIGVQRWFIYDNNSDDDTVSVLDSLRKKKKKANYYNISRHVWPWIKTQEAGFAHCALRARGSCDWVGFIDVDEFFHLPSGLMLNELLRKVSSKYSRVGEVRSSCFNFGPSGLREAPPQGVTVGYTCRMGARERHKSIVKPEALNSSLVNVVHHFHLRNGYRFIHVSEKLMVVNHYKYQVWEVFKHKFYRRVATYVADWREKENVGSRDRAPGLGTRAVEPPDWADRFCDVRDTGLRDGVLRYFRDPATHRLPWQEEVETLERGQQNKTKQNTQLNTSFIMIRYSE